MLKNPIEELYLGLIIVIKAIETFENKYKLVEISDGFKVIIKF